MMGGGGLASTIAPLLVPLEDPLPELLDPPLLDAVGAPLLLLDVVPTPELDEPPAGAPLLPLLDPLDPVGRGDPLELLLTPPPRSDLRGSPGSAAHARPRQVPAKPANRARRRLP